MGSPPGDVKLPGTDHLPLIMVIAISFRNGNFSVGIIPTNPTLDHWKLALGMSITNADGSITPPPFPGADMVVGNSIKGRGHYRLMIVVLSTTCAYAFARLRFRGKSTILQGMLIFQMFPGVCWPWWPSMPCSARSVTTFPWLWLNTHGGLILAYMGGISLHV